ncbi:MAG: asparagine synthase B [Planctomycetota bacterium]
MCGIAGCIGKRDRATIEQMLDRLPHRGPDEIGLHETSDAVLGHTRLSIVDVKKGRQPILADGDRAGIVCNGEIYNYRQLRGELPDRYKFTTDSDTEVALHKYRAEGPQFVRGLDGMFALAAFDNGNYLLARDPIGIKPLYYGFKDEALYFCSELKAIAAAGLDHVDLFPPGMYYTPQTGFVSFYSFPEASGDCIEEVEEAARLVREQVTAAVHKRLLSDPDIHVGSFCSGGLDSSLVTALAAEKLDHIHTFAVGMRNRNGEESDDIKASRIAAAHIGTQHHELVFSEEEYREALPRVIRGLESYDPSLVRCAVPCYFTCKCAADHVTVVLTGEGADEVFAGYHYMKNFPSDQINAEIKRCLKSLHNINLQRADRMGMMFSLELRVPFLDTSLIELCSRITPEMKIRRDPTEADIEKWILRKAFSGTGYLPEEIIWRYKVQYTQGAGCESIGEVIANEELSDADYARLVAEYPDAELGSKEAAYYFSIFNEHLPHKSSRNTVGIWRGFEFPEERRPVSGTLEERTTP